MYFKCIFIFFFLPLTDCTEGYERGNFSQFGASGVFQIHPLWAPAPFFVYCKSSKTRVRTYLLMRGRNGLDFNRNFAEYQAGFGDLNNRDHWLGLEKVGTQVNQPRLYFNCDVRRLRRFAPILFYTSLSLSLSLSLSPVSYTHLTLPTS